MTNRITRALTAEGMSLKVRWLLIGVGAVMLLEQLGNPIVLAVLGLLAASNVYATKHCKTQESYQVYGKQLMGALRLVDAVIVTGVNALPLLRNDKLWLLGVPILLSEAFVSRERLRVGILAGLMIAIQAAILLTGKFSAAQIAVPLGVLGASAALGVILAGFQSREEKLVSHDQRLAAVLDCGAALASNQDLTATIIHTLRSAVTETGASCGYVLLVEDEEQDWMRTEAAFGVEGEFRFPERVQIGTGLSGYVAKMGQPIAISGADDGQKYDGVTEGVRSAVSIPLLTRAYNRNGNAAPEQVMGVMTLLSIDSAECFDSQDMELLRTLASLMAVATANARMDRAQRATFLRTLESLASALEARDQYTQGHSQRVSEVSMLIGERMGLGEDALNELRVGTILHDIGKIGVPDDILNKPDRLTNEEFEVMKSHPVIGFEICKPLRLPEGVLMIIRNHHEKLDGSGYPDGLKGGELPLSLRIVCVADAFDAMSSRRPYRNVMDPKKVLSELSRCAGTQFDPVVVEALKALLETDKMWELYSTHWVEREQKAA
jgi:putative nucleotidyltransferase with HDIG domain